MISEKVHRLCKATSTISSELAKAPASSPGHIRKKLYGNDVIDHDEHIKSFDLSPAAAEDLEKARACGNWGQSTPSELFLRASHFCIEMSEDQLIWSR